MTGWYKQVQTEVNSLSRDPTDAGKLEKLNVWYRRAVLVGHRVYIHCRAMSTMGTRALIPCTLIVDQKKKQWRSIRVMGPSCGSGEPVLFEDKIIWFGERNHLDQINTTLSTSMYDNAIEEWLSCFSAGQAPSRRFGFTCNFLEKRNMAILFGGKDETMHSLNDVHLFDMEGKRWVQPVVKGQPPRARFRHGSCIHNGVFYCYGGLGDRNRLADGIFTLQFSHGGVLTWSKPKLIFNEILPVQLSSFALVPFQGYLIFCGGIGPRDNGLLLYDLETGKLSKLPVVEPIQFFGYSYGTTVFPFESSGLMNVFGINGRVKSYYSIRFTK